MCIIVHVKFIVYDCIGMQAGSINKTLFIGDVSHNFNQIQNHMYYFLFSMWVTCLLELMLLMLELFYKSM